MKVIFFGLGSIGKKHYKNLKTICEVRGIPLDVYAYRSKKIESKVSDNINMIYSIDEIEFDYDIVFITNPTALHFDTLNITKNRGKYYFVEKPIFEKEYDITNFMIANEKYYIAAPLRYKGIMNELKKILNKKRIYNARVICSSYLPNWREDNYTGSYSADPKLGGGVELDCIHEIDYVINMFGFPKDVKAIFGKKSNLLINSNDTANYILEYTDKYVEVHLDYYGKISQRRIEIITENDLIICDFLKNKIISKNEGTIIEINEELNQMYLNEIVYFIDNIMTGKSNTNTLKHASDVLKVAKGVN